MKIDLFNLFKNYENWLGAIYNVLLNLSRFIRLKWEKIMLLGLIPGLSEPQCRTNCYIKSIVY